MLQITIHGHDCVTGGRPYSSLESSLVTEVSSESDCFEQWVACRKAREPIPCCIATTVIDENNLGLRQNSPYFSQNFLNIVLFVEAGNNDRYGDDNDLLPERQDQPASVLTTSPS